jgi:hypothetical protein
MSDPIRIHVRDHTGARTLDATAPPETSLKDLEDALRSRFGFPKDIPFRLFHQEGEVLLPAESTLMSIGPGDTLILVPTGGS